MSVLDAIFSQSVAGNDAAVLALTTELQQAQQLIAAQQSQIDALGIAEDTQGAALAIATLLNAAQEASIAAAQAAADAVDAANDAQQTSLDAATTINTAQSAAITAVQSAIADAVARAAAATVDLHVAAYTASPTTPLTNANFQDAVEACIAAATALAASMTSATVEINGSVRVRIPPGIWFLTRGLVFNGPGLGKQVTPALLGAGINSTILVTTVGMTDVYFAAIRAGGASDVDASYCNRWECGGFSLVGANGAQRNMNGIHITLAMAPHLHDMQIVGFQDAGQSPLYGIGIVVDDPYNDAAADVLGGVRNNQHVQLTNVWSMRNFAGYKFRSCTPVVMKNCHGNQNGYCDVIAESSVLLYWAGGTMQGGSDSSAGVNWYSMHKGQARVISGWNKIQASGTGASGTVCTGDECTITLPGATLVEGVDEYKWLEVRHPTQPYSQAFGADKASGVYLITQIVSATQCKVRRGVASAPSFSGYTWQLRTTGASYIELTGRLYHEGDTYAAVGMYALESTTSNPSIQVHGIVGQDYSGAALVESYANSASIICEDNLPSNGTVFTVRARKAISVRALDSTLEQLDLDEFSREGVICRTTGHEFASRTPSRFGGVYTATSLGAGRLRTMCREAGANVILDPRVTSSVAVTGGTNVTGWTDLIGGTVGALEHAGQYPVLVPSDANFAGKASILFGAGASAALTHGMTLALPAARWSSRSHRPVLFIVARAAHASQLAPGNVCHVKLLDDANSYYEIYFNHPGSLVGVGGALSSQLGTLHTGAAVVPTSDPNYTAPHALIIGSAGRPGLQMDSELGFQHFGYNPERGWVGGHDKVLELGCGNGGPSADLWVAFAATFSHGISVKQREMLLDAAANEFGVAGR